MFKPLGHRLVVHRDPVEETYGEMGIIMHSQEQSKKLEAANAQLGIVVAVGPDAWKAYRMIDDNGVEKNGKPWAKVGDYVLFSKYAGKNVIDPFTPNNEDLVVLNDEDVICIITPEETVVPTGTVRDIRGELV